MLCFMTMEEPGAADSSNMKPVEPSRSPSPNRIRMPKRVIKILSRLVFDLQSGLVCRLDAKIFCFEVSIFKMQALLTRSVLSVSSPKNHASFARVSLFWT